MQQFCALGMLNILTVPLLPFSHLLCLSLSLCFSLGLSLSIRVSQGQCWFAYCSTEQPNVSHLQWDRIIHTHTVCSLVPWTGRGCGQRLVWFPRALLLVWDPVVISCCNNIHTNTHMDTLTHTLHYSVLTCFSVNVSIQVSQSTCRSM